MDIALLKLLQFYEDTYRTGDIIQVKFNYTDNYGEIVEEELIGRLDDILEDYIILDVSEQYHSDMVEIFFKNIIDINLDWD